MPFLKRKKALAEAPHPVAIRKVEAREVKMLNNREMKKGAIIEGMNAVKKCYPGLTLGDIMQFEIEERMSNKPNKHRKEILEAFRKAANKFCEDHGRQEPLF